MGVKLWVFCGLLGLCWPWAALGGDWSGVLSQPSARSLLERRLAEQPNPYLEHDLAQLYEQQEEWLQALYHYRRSAAALPGEVLPQEGVRRMLEKLALPHEPRAFSLTPAQGLLLVWLVAMVAGLLWGGSYSRHNPWWSRGGKLLAALSLGSLLLGAWFWMRPVSVWQVMVEARFRMGPGMSFAEGETLRPGTSVEGTTTLAGWLLIPGRGWIKQARVKKL